MGCLGRFALRAADILKASHKASSCLDMVISFVAMGIFRRRRQELSQSENGRFARSVKAVFLIGEAQLNGRQIDPARCPSLSNKGDHRDRAAHDGSISDCPRKPRMTKSAARRSPLFETGTNDAGEQVNLPWCGSVSELKRKLTTLPEKDDAG